MSERLSRLIKSAVTGDPACLTEPATFVNAGRYVQKNAVNPVAVSDLVVGYNDTVAELLSLFIETSLFTRAEGFHVVPDNSFLLPATMNPVMEWTGEAKPLRASRFSTTPIVMRATPKIGGIVPQTKDSAHLGVKAASLVQRLCLSAANQALNSAFFDPTNDGSGVAPKAITNGAPAVASDGNLWSDLQELRAPFEGDPSRSVIFTDPQTVIDIEAFLGSRGQQWPEHIEMIGVRGSPRDSSGGQLTYLDPAAIAACFGEAVFDVSENATIQLDDDPDDPADASTIQVSGFQLGLLFYRLRVHANWTLLFDNAVRCVTGCLYQPQ